MNWKLLSCRHRRWPVRSRWPWWWCQTCRWRERSRWYVCASRTALSAGRVCSRRWACSYHRAWAAPGQNRLHRCSQPWKRVAQEQGRLCRWPSSSPSSSRRRQRWCSTAGLSSWHPPTTMTTAVPDVAVGLPCSAGTRSGHWPAPSSRPHCCCRHSCYCSRRWLSWKKVSTGWTPVFATAIRETKHELS